MGWAPGGRGLSPRVRGNPDASSAAVEPVGSIPACAGEPRRHRAEGAEKRVYPRVCGGTWAPLDPVEPATGLSPRVRGNLAPGGPGGPGYGSIPACAGEPATATSRRCPARVYPRVCGGTRRLLLGPPPSAGLSPRVRGNPPASVEGLLPAGSIPACAGEPRSSRPAPGSRWVYPRVCGGTSVHRNARSAW